MSTPVPINTPPQHHGRPPKRPHHQRTSTNELTKQMQRMIDIQHQHFEEYGGEDKDKDKQGGKLQQTAKTPPPSVNVTTTTTTTCNNNSNNKGNELVVLGGGEPGVGQGQLIFPHESLASSQQHRCRLNSGSSNGSTSIPNSPVKRAPAAGPEARVSSPKQVVGQTAATPTYKKEENEMETTAAMADSDDDRKGGKRNDEPPEQKVAAAQTETPETATHNLTSTLSRASRANYGSLNVGGGGIHHQDHDFHYGNPDTYHQQEQRQHHHNHPLHHGAGTGLESMMSPHDESSIGDGSHYYRQRKNISWSCCHECCRCFWKPIAQPLKRFLEAEALHRSFCFGAIDGMLTGSGIVSVFCGMKLVPTAYDPSNYGIFAVVLCFSAAACFADSLCMGLGHMWTTHVAAMAAARERHDARSELQQSRAAVKGHLVDMLLAKGMLKMDAMSLADLLEGYPDLFVNVMVGEALVGGDVPGGDQHHPMPYTDPHHHSIPSSHFPNEEMDAARRTHEAMMMGGGTMPSPFYQEGATQPRTAAAGGGGVGGILPRIFSYGQLSENDMEPLEALAVKAASRESRDESLMMMLSFTLFGVLPAAVVHTVWATTSSATSSSYYNYDDLAATANDDDNISFASRAATGSTVIYPQSVAITILACIAWTLGVWKARFLDSNWLMFGIEAVVVLMVCIASAYGVGALLNHVCLPDYVVQIRTEDAD